METYLTLLYVTLEQELAVKDFFIEKGWIYCKPDLSVMTDKVGPIENPQSCIKRNDGIFMDSQLSGNGSLKINRTRVVTEKGREKDFPSQDVTDIKIEISAVEGFLSQLIKEKSEVIETDDQGDGDNDDDFADDLDAFTLKSDTSNTKIHDSPQSGGSKHFSKLPVVTYTTRSGKIMSPVIHGSISADQKCASVKSPKRRKIAANTEAGVEAKMAGEQEAEIDQKPMALVRNKWSNPIRKQALGVKLQCSMCSKEYRLQYHLDKHCKQVHDPNNPPKPKQKSKPHSRQCDICGSVFSRSDILLDHKRRVHQGIRKVVAPVISTCEVCGSTFTRRNHLQEHILVKHSNSKLPYPCKLCEKTFIRPGVREVHMNKNHYKVKPYECTFCRKKFYANMSVKKHMKARICQPDRIKRFKCIKCEKTFANAGNLEMHMTAIHFGGAYKCVCGESVKWSGSVAKHKRRCKAYKDFVVVNGEVEDKLCNVIEVPNSEVLLQNTPKTDSVSTGTEDMLNHENYSVEEEMERDIEQDTLQAVEHITVQAVEQVIEQAVEQVTEQITERDTEQDTIQDSEPAVEQDSEPVV